MLLPYQQRWISDNSPIKIAEKSRRIGFSWADAADSALEAAQAGGQDTYYIGYNIEMAQQYIKDVAYWAKAYQLSVSDFEESVIEENGRSIFTYTIHFLSGYKVSALSSRPANLRSKKGRLRIDEAAFHEDLKELIKAALAVVMWGGSVGIWSTHDGEDNPFNQLIKAVKAGDLDYGYHRVSLDDALSEGFYQRICLTQNQVWTPEAEFAWRSQLYKDYGDAADEELGCIPKKRQNGDPVYPKFDRALNNCTDTVQLGDRLHIGMDFNVTNMNAVVHVVRNGIPRAVSVLSGIADTPAIIAAIKNRYPNHTSLISVYPDASGQSRKSTNASTSDVALLRQAGFTVIVDGSNPAVKDRINAMNTAFCNPLGDRCYLVNASECTPYVEALEKQGWKNGEPDKSQGFDHLPDSAGYFICKFMPISAASETTFAASVRSHSASSRFTGRR
ncbi:MAG: hypothetical protein KME42_14160 [Tildeniella nuda ZEHNDER 1965/U140]|jgi:hypothetical protein|nr:hypothetical protein [Tildeniella nuda ZEHNDER 1965/U140]